MCWDSSGSRADSDSTQTDGRQLNLSPDVAADDPPPSLTGLRHSVEGLAVGRVAVVDQLDGVVQRWDLLLHLADLRVQLVPLPPELLLLLGCLGGGRGELN